MNEFDQELEAALSMQEAREMLTPDDLDRVFIRVQKDDGSGYEAVSCKEVSDKQFNDWANSRMSIVGDESPWSMKERAAFCDQLYQAGQLHILKKDVESTRTIEEIIEYYKQERTSDLLGFEGEILLPYLPVEQVRPFLKEDADLSEWKQTPLTRDSILGEMREYMSFAWDKVQDHRGISASRSVSKMQAWLWLLHDEELLAFAKNERNYPQYGAPILKRICEKYGFPVPSGSDIENMAKGQKCSQDCAGCGSGWTITTV